MRNREALRRNEAILDAPGLAAPHLSPPHGHGSHPRRRAFKPDDVARFDSARNR